MVSDTPSYGVPRLPTFLDRKRAKERELGTVAGEASPAPINRWAVRDEVVSGVTGSSPVLGHMQSSGDLTSRAGTPLVPTVASQGSSARTMRKPLPTPMPGRDRVQSPQLPSVPLHYAPHIIATYESARSGAFAHPASTAQTPQIRLPQLPFPPSPGFATRSRPLPQPTSRRIESAPLPLQGQRLPTPEISQAASPVVAGSVTDPLMARSDTVTSVKSLDRFEITPHGRRPLPRPPIGVGPSRSFDRGMGDVGKEVEDGHPGRRRLVKRSSRSTIQEEEGGSSSSGHEEERASGGDTNPAPEAPSLEVTEEASGPAIDQARSISSAPPNASVIKFPPSTQAPSPAIPTFSFADDETEPDPVQVSGPSIIPAVPTRISHAGPGVFCANCDRVILGKVLTAMGARWHPDCFRCTACKMLLEHVSSYEHDGQAYCHMDYHDKFAPKCYHCETAIVDSRFVTIDDPDPKLGVRHYHELHFFCGECGDPFLDPSRSSAAGTEASRMASGEGEDETKDFVLHGRHAFCVECDIKLHKPKCRNCRQPIVANAVETMGLKWHRDCFRCAECHGPFANDCFFPRDGKAFCQDCFVG